ncbi:Dihydrolipoamide acyltransferase component of branched-chain alpha-keto acid dehydrogenase complex [Paramagnetospirillum magnetotacticum MS-1]|uniref:Dihydrolipoamide acyltransferase component of branched-chain alpha-keto acid dehydrogenase complex n=1 Tax=Paramagnetospirillum magnetotacticum MS-1 TaxID=272627 RepID=A0A0C2YZ79_PARME|nr:alpha/beta fold hydrolase [Paramagnetospirillum magnetotacticum]KIL99965.1 Dihydrolipoamide acyltransferase component of branched-chain alpha-keto acid dehydrogenase complex [Paramagnetospirillum magnetotacticum MS-1]
MKLNAIEAGSAAADRVPLLILHGLLGSARNWGAVVKALGESRRVLALDLPNHGSSPWTEIMDYPFMARELASVIEHLGGRAAIMGHSMGGKAAMTLALSRPELVERLVVVDIAPVSYSHTFAPYIKAMRGVPLGEVSSRGEVEAALAGAIPDKGVRAFLMQNLEGGAGGYRWRPNLAVLGAHMDDILAFPHFPDDTAFQGPTLFVAGETSDYIRPAHEDVIAQFFPKAESVEIPGAGHWVHADNPSAFMSAIGSFL